MKGTEAGFTEYDLKKQTQFMKSKIGVKSYLKGIYGNKPPCGAQKNKANSNPISRLPRPGVAGQGLIPAPDKMA